VKNRVEILLEEAMRWRVTPEQIVSEFTRALRRHDFVIVPREAVDEKALERWSARLARRGRRERARES